MNTGNTQTQVVIDGSHPLCITFSEVIVYRYYMDTFTGHCIQGDRQRCDEGFTLAGLHLSYFALVENNTAHQLDIEMSLLNSAPGCLSYSCEDFGQ